jgi:hypothetical protein
MRGFIAGSLTLIILQVALRTGSTDKLVAGNNALVTMFRRALASDVAGIPDKRKKKTTTGASTTPAPGTVITV